MRAVFDKMLRALTAAAVEPIKDSPLRSFADILIQDGTSFALHDALAGKYPGRVNARLRAVKNRTWTYAGKKTEKSSGHLGSLPVTILRILSGFA